MSPSPVQLSPARLAGFVLIGVAVVAVGLGVFALASNGSSGPSASGTPTTPPNTATGLTSGAASSTSTPTPSPSTTTAPSSTGSPTSIAPPPPTVPSNQPPPVPVLVYNNSLIQGLAKRAAGEFRAAGFDVTYVGSYPYSNLPTTTAFYTTPAEQQIANQLAQRFHMQVQPEGPAFATYPPGVLVILTKDFN